ncbi:hypothetical protein KFU94_00840 [Chloroflexi bacterium TSY]|nr:hypothetical protein [Chloroflexi bacterium TSY]
MRDSLRHEKNVEDMVFSPNSRYVVIVSGGEYIIPSKDRLRLLPSSRYIGKTRLVDAASGRVLASLLRDKSVEEVVFSPNSRYVVIVSGGENIENSWLSSEDNWWRQTLNLMPRYTGEIRLVDTVSRKLLVNLPHESPVNRVVFRLDGRYLATVYDDGTTNLIDTTSRKVRISLPHEKNVEDIVFSPDGRHLATRSTDGQFHFIDIISGEVLAVLQYGHNVREMGFSSDGRRLATKSADGTILFWQIYTSDLVKTACQLLSRNFRSEEWETYVGDIEPYRPTCPNLP